MVAILMLAKMATLALLKIKVFWNISDDVIIFAQDATKYVSNYIWPKFGNSSISMREIITSILKGFDHKNHLLWGVVLVQVQ